MRSLFEELTNGDADFRNYSFCLFFEVCERRILVLLVSWKAVSLEWDYVSYIPAERSFYSYYRTKYVNGESQI